ncbi:MAG TPA: Holliday junction resolvase RuvX [Pyrinomonadaceae bacterium]|nr:Holliday junction resolvase RuvX [Pyrinomonadaceae bacterium]
MKPEREDAAARVPSESPGRLLAIDLGAKRVGVAVSDELRITVKPLPSIVRRSWKDFLRRIVALVETYDARGMVIGLPLRLDGVEGEAAQDARAVASKFQRSLGIPVYLQDERLTTFEAASNLRSGARSEQEIDAAIDSESAALILRDFIVRNDRPTALENST